MIPNNSEIWITSKNILYVEYMSKIPVLVEDDDGIMVILDFRVSKHLAVLIKHLEKINVEFYPALSACERGLIASMIDAIADKNFFKASNKLDLDMSIHISNYIKKYDCYDIFNSCYDVRSKKHLATYFDYFTNQKFFVVKNEEIRDKIVYLKREVKLNLIF